MRADVFQPLAGPDAVRVDANFSNTPVRGTMVTLIGFVVVAVGYGLVRFSYGQFLPAIRADLGLSEGFAGMLSSALFVGNCAALLIAAVATERWGGRAIATLAACFATIGLLGMAVAQSPWVFAAALLIAGSSAGLSMPPLVMAAMQTVAPRRRGRSTSIMNAGTCAGIALSGPIAIYMSGDWRVAFMGFAAIGAVAAFGTACILPPYRPNAPDIARSRAVWSDTSLRPLLFSSFGLGLVSAIYWTYGGEVLSGLGVWSGQDISKLWIIIGVAGFLGAPAGLLVQRWGLDTIHRLGFVLIAASIVLLSMAHLLPGAAIGGAILFGGAYILQTANYIIWAMRAGGVDEARAVKITAASFFMLPLGQITGTIAFGWAFQTLGLPVTLNIAVLITLFFCCSVRAESTAQTPKEPDALQPLPAANLALQPAHVVPQRRSKLFFMHPRAESLSPDFRDALIQRVAVRQP